ncbi:MAG: beta-galactosidase [Verrucomicrobia bacterium]|nr:beta-galactosidase [Verrucomicrobiota bacterium]
MRAFPLLVILCLASFHPEVVVAEPLPAPWTDYQVILWLGDSAGKHPGSDAQFAERMKEMGVTAVSAQQDADPSPWTAAGLRFYVENIVNRGLCLKWGSEVRDWDRFVTDWAKNGRPTSALIRGPSLDDPAWQAAALKQMRTVVQAQRARGPLLYDIRDELSTTISANPFDYDFHPKALESFRRWLRESYGTLEALNQEWDATFASWESVVPFTTDEIKARMASGRSQPGQKPDRHEVQQTRFDASTAGASPGRWNFSPWADFRTYMDIALARTLDQLRQASHAIDPSTPVGIEGTQMPHAFGGYDLWRLSQALDWVEPYDIGNAREIFGDFMPRGAFLTTIGESRALEAQRRLWHLLLLGDCGSLVWWSEDCVRWNGPGWELTDRARQLAPVLRSLRGPLAQVLRRASRETDPILLHYSQASVQVDWLLESIPDGSTWLRRFSSFESAHNRMAQARNQWLKGLQDLGYSPRFVSAAEIENGRLRERERGVVVLPRSYALSDREAAELTRFAAAGEEASGKRAILADGSPGMFDAHGKLRGRPAIAAVFPAIASETLCRTATAKPTSTPAGVTSAHTGIVTQRMTADAAAEWKTFMAWLEDQTRAIERSAQTPVEDRVRIHRYRLGAARLLAFERGVDYQMSESLKAQGGNTALETPIETTARLSEPGEIYDLESGKHLGRSDQIRFRLDPWKPSVFAVLKQRAPESEPVLETLMKMAR